MFFSPSIFLVVAEFFVLRINLYILLFFFLKKINQDDEMKTDNIRNPKHLNPPIDSLLKALFEQSSLISVIVFVSWCTGACSIYSILKKQANTSCYIKSLGEVTMLRFGQLNSKEVEMDTSVDKAVD